MKARSTGAILLRGTCENGVYIFPNSMVAPSTPKMVAYVHERTSFDGWHKRLGYPSIKVVQNLVNLFSLPLTTNKLPLSCPSCSINKVHQQPFGSTSFQSHSPLEIIYSDVWGPVHITGLNGEHYYLIFVDHYTKYIWFYPMSTKSLVSTVFPQFKLLVETRFKCSIKSLYLDNGGEFLSLKKYLSDHGISHYTTALHTPQQNGVSKRRHRHLVETGITLLHDAFLSLSYWPHAFQIATYLINRQPTPLLKHKSPFEVLFGQRPNYLKLRKFGCLCYPLTRPYNTHKLQPKSIPCIFLGYSQTQNAYKCMDPLTNRLYISWHVTFDELQSPFLSKTKHGPSAETHLFSSAPHLFLQQNPCPNFLPLLLPFLLLHLVPIAPHSHH